MKLPTDVTVDQLLVGSKVTLKSGGPLMTVKAINSENIECIWFDRRENLHVRVFDWRCLKLGNSDVVIVMAPSPSGKKAGPPPMPREKMQ